MCLEKSDCNQVANRGRNIKCHHAEPVNSAHFYSLIMLINRAYKNYSNSSFLGKCFYIKTERVGEILVMGMVVGPWC